MADQFTEVSRSGFGRNILRSIVGVPVGLLLFLGSFAVLWFTAGRTDWAQVAEHTAVAPAAPAGGFDGQRVSVTGPITAPEPLGDPELLAPGAWVSLRRDVETFAWVEREESRSRSHVGGSTSTTTTYTYTTEWTREVKPAGQFRHPEGHDNPPPMFESTRFHSPRVSVGAWSLQTDPDTLPSGGALALNTLARTGRGAGFYVANDALYSSPSATQNPRLGDTRVRFYGLPAGVTVTAFGQAAGAALVPAQVEDSPWLRVLEGDRGAAIDTLHTEYEVTGWVGRIVGFLMMWIGMNMFLGPISTVLNVLPALGSASGFVIFLVTFPAALVLTAVAVAVTVLLHSLAATAAAVFAVLLVLMFLARRRKNA